MNCLFCPKQILLITDLYIGTTTSIHLYLDCPICETIYTFEREVPKRLLQYSFRHKNYKLTFWPVIINDNLNYNVVRPHFILSYGSFPPYHPENVLELKHL